MKDNFTLCGLFLIIYFHPRKPFCHCTPASHYPGQFANTNWSEALLTKWMKFTKQSWKFTWNSQANLPVSFCVWEIFQRKLYSICLYLQLEHCVLLRMSSFVLYHLMQFPILLLRGTVLGLVSNNLPIPPDLYQQT